MTQSMPIKSVRRRAASSGRHSRRTAGKLVCSLAAIAVGTAAQADLLVDDFTTGSTSGWVNQGAGNWFGGWQPATVPGNDRAVWAWGGTSYNIQGSSFQWLNGNNERYYNNIQANQDGALYVEYGQVDLPPGDPADPIDLDLTPYSTLEVDFTSNDVLNMAIQLGSDGSNNGNRDLLFQSVAASSGPQSVIMPMSDFASSLGSGANLSDVNWLSFNFMLHANTGFTMNRIRFNSVPEPASCLVVAGGCLLFRKRRKI